MSTGSLGGGQALAGRWGVGQAMGCPQEGSADSSQSGPLEAGVSAAHGGGGVGWGGVYVAYFQASSKRLAGFFLLHLLLPDFFHPPQRRKKCYCF